MLGAQIWETVSEWMVTAGERIMSSPKESELMDSHDLVLRSDNESAEEEKSDEKEKSLPEKKEGECGFCLFMKGGGCKDAFMDWDNCVQKAEKEEADFTKCVDLTEAMLKCMLLHSDYYEPVLRAHYKAVREEASTVLEKEAAASEGSNQKIETK